MGIGAVAEPLVIIVLLLGGTWVNRARFYTGTRRQPYHSGKRVDSPSGLESGPSSPVEETANLLAQDSVPHAREGSWRRRELNIAGWKKEIWSPDTQVFDDRLLSRLLQRFPFLVEVWYWALIYWVYQLGRAFTAVTLVQGTVHTARRHALQLIHLEQRLHLFHEGAIQQFFMAYPNLMHWTNRLYSFIHIPGTILFLVFLYHYTITSNHPTSVSSPSRSGRSSGADSALYTARRRTMATCNLLAFIIFTTWPCMPPRLLSDPTYTGPDAAEAKSYSFVDTVHSAQGESSVWTQNKFCNQYAAMPSLHFGYSLLVGLTIATLPLAPRRKKKKSAGFCVVGVRVGMLEWRRGIVIALGLAYPAVILVAIVATANHFILDAVAGAVVCAVAWKANGVLLNLLALEDWFLWCLRLHKPDVATGMEAGNVKHWVKRLAEDDK